MWRPPVAAAAAALRIEVRVPVGVMDPGSEGMDGMGGAPLQLTLGLGVLLLASEKGSAAASGEPGTVASATGPPAERLGVARTGVLPWGEKDIGTTRLGLRGEGQGNGKAHGKV